MTLLRICPLILLLVLLGSACAPDRTPELDAIREATFRYQFRNNASGLQQRATVYFLVLRDPQTRQWLDPGEALLRQFKNHPPRIAKMSEAKRSGSDGVSDKQTGERGLIFIVGKIRWLASDRVDVEGGYYEAGESSSGNIYHLRKKDGKWEVVNDTMRWISHLERPLHHGARPFERTSTRFVSGRFA